MPGVWLAGPLGGSHSLRLASKILRQTGSGTFRILEDWGPNRGVICKSLTGLNDNWSYKSFLWIVRFKLCRSFRDAKAKTVFLKNSYKKCEGMILLLVETLGKPLGEIMDVVSWGFLFKSTDAFPCLRHWKFYFVWFSLPLTVKFHCY